MKITDVILFKLSGRWSGPTFPPGDRQARQIDVYAEFNAIEGMPQPKDGQPMEAIYVEVQTHEGVSGQFGPIDETQAFIIRQSLRPLLLGRDPLATETLLDQMVQSIQVSQP